MWIALILLSRAAYPSENIDDLVSAARAMRLADDPVWIRLGHWRPRRTGGWHSQAQGEFFLAPDGNRNPAAELEATLRGMFGLIPNTADQTERHVVPAECRFPARAAWLAGKLSIDPARLPNPECPQLADFLRKLEPAGASLVFSSYYLNNPASAFGHTFLRIHRRFEGVSQEKRELLDYAIDFSGAPDTDNPLLYVTKGLTGLFPGNFHVLPYYYKVREYGDYESRDIWEYDLALTQPQIDMLVAHLFELGSAIFPYYYVSENCSYQIIAALEPALPEARLVDRLKWPVIPADTVKTLYEIPGLVSAVRYRPSLVTQFTARVAGLDSHESAAVRELADNAEAPLDPSLDPVRVLDAASDLIDVRYAHELPFEPNGKGGMIKRRVLERRAQILKPSQELEIETPSDRQPQLAHGSGRAGVSGGYSDVAGGFAAIDWRLNLHDLGEPARGYPELSQIEFLPVELRYYPRPQTLQLERFDFVNLTSLTPFTLFDPTASRKVFIGAHRIRDDGCGGCLAFAAGYSSGFTFATSAGGLAIFALADGTFEASPDLKGIWQVQAIRFGIGPSGGLRLRLGEQGVFLAQGGWRWLPGAIAHQTWFAQSSLEVQPLRWLALRVTGRKDVSAAEVAGQLFFYF